jgi:hypothetical protein
MARRRHYVPEWIMDVPITRRPSVAHFARRRGNPSGRYCRVCGHDIPKGSGRRSYCSARCAARAG